MHSDGSFEYTGTPMWLGSEISELVYYQYLQYLGQQKLSKQHIKKINIIHVTQLLFCLFDLLSSSDVLSFLSLLSCGVYSKTCVKRPLKNRQNKDLNDKW